MREYLMTVKLEAFKMRHQGFLFIWFCLTAMPLAWSLYSLFRISHSDTVIVEIPDPVLYYFNEQTSVTMILALFLPFMASVLISKLADNENKTDAWKMLKTNDQNMGVLWTVKFLIVYTLMELTSLILFTATYFVVYMQRGIPVPVKTLSMAFLGLSGANIITLTIAQIVSFYYKNQIIALIEGLVGGMFGIISPLLPYAVVKFIPWGYYTMTMLASTSTPGFSLSGKRIWIYHALEPDYGIIAAVTLVFGVVNILARWYFTRKEL